VAVGWVLLRNIDDNREDAKNAKGCFGVLCVLRVFALDFDFFRTGRMFDDTTNDENGSAASGLSVILFS
jgi:hypothetical protein